MQPIQFVTFIKIIFKKAVKNICINRTNFSSIPVRLISTKINTKKIWRETTTRLPLPAITHILNSMRYIFFFTFINGKLLFSIRSAIIRKIIVLFFGPLLAVSHTTYWICMKLKYLNYEIWILVKL